MSQEDSRNPCKPRFKGIENFLRRVAYNLGNTPSQTEVKIISCIPIDVTDLQERILILEKELSATRKKNATNKIAEKRAATIERAIHYSPKVNRCNTVSKCDLKAYYDDKSKQILTPCCDISSEENRSNISYVYSSNVKPRVEALYERPKSTQSLKSKWDSRKRTGNERVKNIFKKRRKKKTTQEKSRGRTQMIYYAHTKMHNKDVLSHSYLADVFRKHHDPRLVVDEFSDTSQYSQPICRDLKHNCKHSSPYDLDICSCCNGGFRNLDIYMNDFNTIFHTNNIKKVNNNNMSNLVDLIPVKEKPVKTKLILKKENTKIKPKSNNNIECWPEKVRTKRRYNSPNEFDKIDVPVQNKLEKNTGIKHSRKYVKCDKTIVKSNQQTGVETSNSCCIDCGNIYVKPPTVPIRSNLRLFKIKDKDTKVFKLAENVQRIKLKTAINDCTKTEAALNEIKRILQAVLTEVKTNAVVTRIVKDEKMKKDAIVQKEVSHDNMERSTFLNSFTYNTSNCANPYLVPYSGQIPLAQYCFPNIAYDPINYPISRVYPHMCTFCHKYEGLQLSEKPVITTSTNTDEVPHETNIKETENLIKEIYKSVALNMDYHSRENSSGYDDIKSTFNDSMISDRKACADTSANDCKVMKRDVQVEALFSTTTNTTRTASNVFYTSMSSKSRYRSKSLRCDSFNTEGNEKIIPKFTKNNYISEGCGFSDTIISTESDDKIAVQNTENIKDKKTGLIKNMFQSVFKKKKEINKNEQNIVENTSETTLTDSDDYETIYSEKANNTPHMQKQKKWPGINYIRPPANLNRKMTPHMEQENKRQWNEYLRENEYYAPKSMNTSPLHRDHRSKQIYHRNYEARHVIVQPRHFKNYELTTLNDGNDVVNKTGGAKDNDRKNEISWLKKHKLGINCGKRWKSFILNN